jgi:ABC-2 type transport system ATP-binding protein
MIEVKKLTKRYGAQVAVDALSFRVRAGHVTGFLGPNGAGKSTTMRMILGLDRPISGEVTIAGRQYGTLRRPLFNVGALLDATAVPAGRAARNHLAALARSNGIGRRRVDEVLADVGLSEVASKRVGTFSLGMKQRLGIAAALLGDPPVLMFDEPVNGLDPEGIRWIRGLFQRLAAEGRTVLVSSHLMGEMALTAEDLIIIGRGRLITHTSVAEFTANAGSASVVVRTPCSRDLVPLLHGPHVTVTEASDGELHVDGLDADRIGEIALQAGLVLHELHTIGASLEEAFMELTDSSVDYRPTPSAAQAAATGTKGNS